MEFNSQSAVAYARLIITIAASVAATFGWTLDAELWLSIVLSVFALALFCWSWWKNNNVTKAAQDAQIVLNELKAKETTKDGASDE